MTSPGNLARATAILGGLSVRHPIPYMGSVPLKIDPAVIEAVAAELDAAEQRAEARIAELEARLVVAECSPLGAKVYRYLRDHGEQTTAQLCATLGITRMHVGNVTKPLILSGRVVRVAHGVYRAVNEVGATL